MLLKIMENDIINEENTKNPKKLKFKGNLQAICMLALGGRLFATVESQWFNSYITNVLDEPYRLVALMITFSAIFELVTAVIVGAISDSLPNNKWGRRRPFILGGVIAGVCIIIVSFQSTYLGVFILDVFIISIFGSMATSMMNAIVADNYKIEERGRANAKVNIFYTIGDILLLIGLVITTTYLYESPIVQHRFILIGVGSILIFTSLFFFFTMKEPEIDYIPDKWTVQLKKMINFKEMIEHKEFFKFFLILLMVTIATYIYQPYLVAYLIESQGAIKIQHIVFLVIGYVTGMVVALSKTGKWLDSNPRKKITMIMVFSAGIGFCFISFLADVQNPSDIGFFFAMFAFFFVQFGSTGLYISQSTWAQDLLPIKARGKFNGIIGIMWAISQIPGLWIGAYIADTFGTRWIFLGSGIVLLLTGQLFWFAKETFQKEKIEEIFEEL